MMGGALGLAAALHTLAPMPKQTTTCIRWYRADTGITLNGSTVSAWVDQSPTGFTAVQATASKQPVFNGSDANFKNRPSLTSDGVDDNMTNGSTPNAACSMFVVGNKLNVNASYCGLWRIHPFIMMSRFLVAGDKWGAYVAAEAASAMTLGAAAKTLAIISRSATDNDMRINDVLDSNFNGTAYLNQTTERLFCNSQTAQTHDGSIAEAVLDTATDAATVTRYHSYLRGRYGT